VGVYNGGGWLVGLCCCVVIQRLKYLEQRLLFAFIFVPPCWTHFPVSPPLPLSIPPSSRAPPLPLLDLCFLFPFGIVICILFFWVYNSVSLGPFSRACVCGGGGFLQCLAPFRLNLRRRDGVGQPVVAFSLNIGHHGTSGMALLETAVACFSRRVCVSAARLLLFAPCFSGMALGVVVVVACGLDIVCSRHQNFRDGVGVDHGRRDMRALGILCCSLGFCVAILHTTGGSE